MSWGEGRKQLTEVFFIGGNGKIKGKKKK